MPKRSAPVEFYRLGSRDEREIGRWALRKLLPVLVKYQRRHGPGFELEMKELEKLLDVTRPMIYQGMVALRAIGALRIERQKRDWLHHYAPTIDPECKLHGAHEGVSLERRERWKVVHEGRPGGCTCTSNNVLERRWWRNRYFVQAKMNTVNSRGDIHVPQDAWDAYKAGKLKREDVDEVLPSGKLGLFRRLCIRLAEKAERSRRSVEMRNFKKFLRRTFPPITNKEVVIFGCSLNNQKTPRPESSDGAAHICWAKAPEGMTNFRASNSKLPRNREDRFHLRSHQSVNSGIPYLPEPKPEILNIAPIRLPKELSPEFRVLHLLKMYRQYVEKHYKIRTHYFAHTNLHSVGKLKFFKKLAEASDVLVEHEMPPERWIDWAIHRLKNMYRQGKPSRFEHKPPPLLAVLSKNFITKCVKWCEKDETYPWLIRKAVASNHAIEQRCRCDEALRRAKGSRNPFVTFPMWYVEKRRREIKSGFTDPMRLYPR